MKGKSLAVRALWLLLVFSPNGASQTVDSAKGQLVEPTQGNSPMKVQLQVPTPWRSVVDQNCKEINLIRFAGRSFTVDWGDGKRFPDRTSEDGFCGLSHTYGVPGTYTIKATIRSFTDCCLPPFSRNLWKDSARVVVTGNRNVPAIEFLTPVGGEFLKYETLPEIKLKLVLDEKSDLIIDFLSEDGTVIGTETKKGISYAGEVRASLVAANRTVVYTLHRKGLSKAFVRVRVLRNGKTILTKDSSHVTFITQSPPESLWVDYSSGGPPLSVNAHLSFDNPDSECMSYRLNWGDDTPPVMVYRGKSQSQCSTIAPEKVEKLVPHTYAAPGRYTITIGTIDSSPTRDLDQKLPEEVHSVYVE